MSLWRYEDRRTVILTLAIMCGTIAYVLGTALYVVHVQIGLGDEFDDEYATNAFTIPGRYLYWGLFGPPILWFANANLALFASADRSSMCVRLTTGITVWSLCTIGVTTLFLMRYISATNKAWNTWIPAEIVLVVSGLFIVTISTILLIYATYRRAREIDEEGYDSDCSRASVFSGKKGVVDEKYKVVKRRTLEFSDSDEENP
eukprot:c23224_g1_i1.p1 GENE.c23224_g1_i1~~c23224_g1_i1.p1  ORF type:complete len:203 (+),score=40.22 c23224_g1_i1:33-641(+)